MYKEWDIEPNQMQFSYAGLNCLIERNNVFGFLNAYVFVPESNIYHGLDYDVLNNLFSKELSVEISFGDFKNGKFAFGLSFSSIKDYIPNSPPDELDPLIEALKKMTGINPSEKDYKNFEYAISKVSKLAELIALKTR